MQLSWKLLLASLYLQASSTIAVNDRSNTQLRGRVDNERGRVSILDNEPTAGFDVNSSYDRYAAFFTEKLDTRSSAAAAAVAGPMEYAAFQDKLDVVSSKVFSSQLATSRGDTKASLFYMEWSVSGPDRGCTRTEKPRIKLQCNNGGRIHVDQACIILGEDIAVCTHPYSENFDYDSKYMAVWCSGTGGSELGLSASLASGSASCLSPSSEASHALSLGQACGPLKSLDFHLKIKESSCEDPRQFTPAETANDNPKCMEVAEASPDFLEIEIRPVNTNASTADASCIYDVSM